VTIILTPEMRQRIESRADSMLSSYWFDFEPTGDENVDLILGAVALAGKYAHSTKWWNEDDDPRGYSLADLIQAAANHAAGVKNGSTPGSRRAETEAGQTGSDSRDTGRDRDAKGGAS